ncbi:MAG TPA: hypothetical protein VD867_08875 [Burkholderiales bacterium]|nr:hypothetical protein [Burkholderiales bacterium]
MSTFGIRALILLAMSNLCWATSPAADPPVAKLDEEMSKQKKIYQTRDPKALEAYTVDRSLSVYANGLASGFAQELTRLGPEDRWLDIGAGEGQAILDYYTPGYDLIEPEGRKPRGRKAQAVAISIEDRSTPRWRQVAGDIGINHLQYFSDKPLRDYSVDELGRFQVITDVVGGFSYTDNLTLFMEKVLAFLAPNGSFYTVLQDVRWEDGTNHPHYEGSKFLTEISHPDGSEMKVCSWLKQITCAQVTCESKANWEPPMEAFRVRKTCSEVEVPSLATVQYKAGTPPERRFRLKTGKGVK